MNILITSAGRRVSLVNFFKSHLKKIFPDALVCTTDMNPSMSSACCVADKAFQVCAIKDPNYISELLAICNSHRIQMLVPTIDTDLLILSEHRNWFEQMGTHCVISDPKLVRTFLNKRLTHDYFEEISLTPIKEYTEANVCFPVFIKPTCGSGSIGSFVVHKRYEKELLFSDDTCVVQEYISPSDFEEYTLDLYFNKDSVLKCVVPRLRIEVRAGEVSKSRTVNDAQIKDIAKKFEQIKGLRGCITVQVFKHKSNSKIIGIEVNPRFGGGYPLSEFSGATYTLWLIQEYLLHQEIEAFDTWKDGMTMLRYDKEIIF